MNNIMKAMIITAPAMAVLFAYSILKQNEISTRIELESAKFDSEFSEMMKSKLTTNSNETDFWTMRQRKAEQAEKEKEEELKKQKEKREQFEREFERALNETQAQK